MIAGRIVRYARRRAGLSQRELAERVGVAQPAIARIESGRVSPRADTLEHILNACGLRLTIETRRGEGVDRTVIRELLLQSPDERARRAAAEANSVDALLDAVER